MLLCALGVVCARRAGLWDLGADGQYLMGGAAALFALARGLPPWAAPALSVLTGAVWGGLCGALKARFCLSEILGGAMMNGIALCIIGAAALPVPSRAVLPSLVMLPGGGCITAALPVSAGAAVFAGAVLKRSRLGYRMRAADPGLGAKLFPGMGGGGITCAAMAFSGAMAGLGGGLAAMSAVWEGAPALPTAGIFAFTSAVLGGMGIAGTAAASLVVSCLISACALLPGEGYFAGNAGAGTVFAVCLCGAATLLRASVFAETRPRRGARTPSEGPGKTMDVQKRS